MELIPFRRKNNPPVVKSPQERAFDSVIEAQNTDTTLKNRVANYCIFKDAVCLLFVLTMFVLAAAGYVPVVFVLTPIVYVVIKMRGKNFDRVVESIFPKRE